MRRDIWQRQSMSDNLIAAIIAHIAAR